jgi:hypothetical protein
MRERDHPAPVAAGDSYTDEDPGAASGTEAAPFPEHEFVLHSPPA